MLSRLLNKELHNKKSVVDDDVYYYYPKYKIKPLEQMWMIKKKDVNRQQDFYKAWDGLIKERRVDYRTWSLNQNCGVAKDFTFSFFYLLIFETGGVTR